MDHHEIIDVDAEEDEVKAEEDEVKAVGNLGEHLIAPHQMQTLLTTALPAHPGKVWPVFDKKQKSKDLHDYFPKADALLRAVPQPPQPILPRVRLTMHTGEVPPCIACHEALVFSPPSPEQPPCVLRCGHLVHEICFRGLNYRTDTSLEPYTWTCPGTDCTNSSRCWWNAVEMKWEGGCNVGAIPLRMD